MRITLAVLAVAAGWARPAAAQALKATGGFSLYGEAYDHEGFGKASRPVNTGRVTANLTLSLFDGAITAPLSALISTDQVQFRQSINQIGLSPTYKTTTFYLGHFTPQYSSYTAADASLLGAGLELHPGRWRLGVVDGRARKAIPFDTGKANEPQFERSMIGGRLGYGDLQGTFLDVFAVRAQDDPGSLGTSGDSLFTTQPEASTVVGLKGQLRRGNVQVLGEAARAEYDRDRRADAPMVRDNAGSLKLVYNRPTWSLGSTVEYVGPGFTTLGNSGLKSDHLDYGVTGQARLAGGRFNVNGMGGWRKNNLDDDLEATTTGALYNLNVSWQVSPFFGLDAQATNNVHDSRAKDDTSSIKSVSGQYSLTPRFVWRTGSAQHVLVGVATVQQTENTTPGSVSLADVTTRVLLGTWTVAFPSGLALTATVNDTRVEVDTLVTTVTTLTPGLAYSLLQHKVTVSLQAQFTRAKQSATGAEDKEVFPLAQVAYSFGRGQSLSLRSSVRHHELGTPAGEKFDERVVSVQYSASFR